MLCELCHRNPEYITIKTTAQGITYEKHICRECSAALGYVDCFNNRTCRYCGRSLEDIKRTLLVGCERCYEQFQDELKPIIERVQKL